ncbi:alpha/beta fold hydrolase [Nonomuraea sp. NPDC005501]|uniref:alpha/beta hydrolase family protein n=1 Tax=Nonomuraea sp. NPDC005501 TaxID=3156884 RepID=UPI0033BEDA50
MPPVPVLFLPGPWRPPTGWGRWAPVFEEAGYAALTPPARADLTDLTDLISRLERRPAIIGHSTGALLTQILAGRGLAAASVAVSPTRETPPPGYDRFRHAFANAVHEQEAERLYETLHTPATRPHHPWTEPDIHHTAHDRGPLLIITGELDRTAPWALAHATYRNHARNRHHLTEIIEMPGRGHSLTVDSGWREVCGTALTFIQRFVDP